MITRWIVLLGLLLISADVGAQQALVRNYANAQLEIGQGYLTHYDGICYLLLPTHVAAESGAAAGLLGEGVPPLLGETTAYSDLDDDVSIATVAGNLTGDCGYSATSISRAVDRYVTSSGVATIRSVNGDGTIAQLSVTLLDDDGSLFLRVQPTNSSNQLRKGNSGSLLMAGDTPIGMLQSIDARNGIGKVIRLDQMLEKFDRYVAGRREDQASAAVAGSLQVSNWTAMPVDSASRALNLVASGDEPPWKARVESWPVEVEIDLGGERLAVAGVELDGVVDDPAMLPTSVEILISATSDGRRWRSVAGGSIEYVGGQAVFKLAPTWARRIRLVFSANAGTPGLIALRRIRVLLAP